jgi:hypothetical protein
MRATNPRARILSPPSGLSYPSKPYCNASASDDEPKASRLESDLERQKRLGSVVDILGRYIYWRVWDFAVSYSDVTTGSTIGRCEIVMFASFGSYIEA